MPRRGRRDGRRPCDSAEALWYKIHMCELCLKHGDGEIWYRNARNYAQDLLADVRRRRFIEDFYRSTMTEGIVARVTGSPCPRSGGVGRLAPRGVSCEPGGHCGPGEVLS